MRAVALVFALLVSGPALAQDGCAPNRVDLRGPWGSARFTVEIADDNAERAQGLMHREELARNRGMLFVYDAPRRASFWMRNTLIPLDMIFIGPEGEVQRVHENARPLDETSIDGGNGILAVLEINGGISDQLGIDAGTEVRHPAFGDDAAWSCDG